jgi:hypothetical protein
MGKRTKTREAQRRAVEQALAARLRAHKNRQRRRHKVRDAAFIASFREFPPTYRGIIEQYRPLALRAPEDWRCNIRVRCPKMRFLELVRFSFARFPAAYHLEQAWLPLDEVAETGAVAGDGFDFRRWYIIAAQGRSLYQEALRPLLSRAEVHHFLTAPREIASSQRALWYATARIYTDARRAVRVARTKIAAYPVTLCFWREVARFFALNQTTIIEMNDLIDYLEAEVEDPSFTLAGRTLPALRERMAAWNDMLVFRK